MISKGEDADTGEQDEQRRLARVLFVQRSVWALVAVLALYTCFLAHLALAGGRVGELAVAFLDVGQGDAIFIETPKGRQVLIDGGKNRAVLSGLAAVMGFQDRTIDVVVATHPDLDHIGGLPYVFDRYAVGMVLEPGVLDDGADYDAFLGAVEAEGLEAVLVHSGMRMMLEEGIELAFLFPEGDASEMEANSASVVVRLTYGDTAFLLTGDAPSSIERYLVARYGIALESDVLKLGHHGSKTSTSDEFVRAVAPDYAVVSAGCGNSYGHPHEEVLTRLADAQVTVYDTCSEGRVMFRSNGTRVEKY